MRSSDNPGEAVPMPAAHPLNLARVRRAAPAGSASARGLKPVPETVAIFGLNLSRMSYACTLDWLEGAVLRQESVRVCVFSANADQMVRCRRDPVFRECYQTAGLVVPDGMPVVWAARLLGRPLAERVTGIDLMDGLCRLAAGSGWRCFLLGSQAEVAGRAAANLTRRFPGLVVCGWHDGYFSPEPWNQPKDATPDADGEIVSQINAAQTEILFVGMGSPRQELWLQRNFARLRCRLALPVGGAFEVIAGRRKRAPLWMQRCGLEWGWRLLQEPRRLGRRYLIEDVKFLFLIAHELRSRPGPSPAGAAGA
jgi:N-acetylglucosaminyldiphosphoundecaprenol N-acetyl-beta-D-mannosaminyltransferase